MGHLPVGERVRDRREGGIAGIVAGLVHTGEPVLLVAADATLRARQLASIVGGLRLCSHAALRAEGAPVLCIPHVGGRYANLHYAHDRLLERAVEVHSDWGTFDWLLMDAFATGARVGIAANSDGL